jgi:hypothetical protein
MPAGSLRLEHLSRAEHERRERRRAIDVTSERWKERRRRNKGGLQSFFSKDFQISACFLQGFPKKALAVLWYIKGLHGSKPGKASFPNFSRLPPPFRRISAFFTPPFVDSRHTGTRALSRSPASFTCRSKVGHPGRKPPNHADAGPRHSAHRTRPRRRGDRNEAAGPCASAPLRSFPRPAAFRTIGDAQQLASRRDHWGAIQSDAQYAIDSTNRWRLSRW